MVDVASANADGVFAVPVPVPGDGGVVRAPVLEREIGRPAGQRVLDEEFVAAFDGDGVLAVPVPVAVERLVRGLPVAEDVVGVAAGQ